MRNGIVTFICILVMSASMANAGDVGFDVNVNVGNRPPLAPVYVNQPVVIEEPPIFVEPPSLGFYVAVGVPYDLVFVSNIYYLYRGNTWYRAPHYNGPWVVAPYRSLPPGLRKHKYERIRYYRDQEYRRYHGDEAHYRGRHFRPEKEWKKQRKEERKQWKEDKKREKEERKQGKHGGREN